MSYSFRDTMKKQLAREQAEVQEEVVAPEVGAEETLEPTFTTDEIAEMEEVKAQEAEVDSLAEGNELIDQIQDRIDANNEMIEGEAEPTEAQVVQAVGEAKHFAYLTAKIDNFVTESIDFMVNGQRYALATESFSFSAKSRREQVKDVNLALEGIAASIANGLKDFAKKVIETIKNIANKVKELFSKRAKIINFAEKNKANIIAMYKDTDHIYSAVMALGVDALENIRKKVEGNKIRLANNMGIALSYRDIFKNPDLDVELTDHLKIVQALGNMKGLMPFLLDVVNRLKSELDIKKNSVSDILKSIPVQAFIKLGSLKPLGASELLVKTDIPESPFGKDKSTFEWYAKEFPAMLEAYNYTKPDLFDKYAKYSVDLFTVPIHAAAEITDNQYVKIINGVANGLKNALSTIRNINDAIYLEIETCVQVYQMYSKSKSQGENK